MTTKPSELTVFREMANQAKERADKATAGPWFYWEHVQYGSRMHGVKFSKNGGNETHCPRSDDSRFISEARSDVPNLADAVIALVDEVERLQANTPASIRGAWMKAWYGPF